MTTFTYKAVDKTGHETSGRLSAETRAGALDQIAAQGLMPVDVAERAEAKPEVQKTGALSGRVSQSQVESFTREMSNLLGAGVPLSRALQILMRESTNAAVRRQWTAIHDDVVDGTPLADALGKFPRSFSRVYVAMVRAGEAGGFLDVVLAQIADFRQRERDLMGRVKAAMVYPCVLACLATGVLIFLLTFFIPRFSTMFADFGGALPWLTRAIVGTSRFVKSYGVLILAAAVVLGVIAHRTLASDAGKRAFERALLAVPALGKVLARFALVRFCRMLGTLIGAGVPLVSALRTAQEALGNQTLADAVGQATEDVQHGAPLARSLGACESLFPGSVVEMVAVAEESGRLDKELVRLSTVYEADLDRQLRMLVSVVEPLLLFVMAGVIGTVVLGMLLPVFTLQELIR